MCLKNKRNFIGAEINLERFNLAIDRIKEG